MAMAVFVSILDPTAFPVWRGLIGHHGRTGVIVVMVGIVTSWSGFILRRVYQRALRLQSLLFGV